MDDYLRYTGGDHVVIGGTERGRHPHRRRGRRHALGRRRRRPPRGRLRRRPPARRRRRRHHHRQRHRHRRGRRHPRRRRQRRHQRRQRPRPDLRRRRQRLHLRRHRGQDRLGGARQRLHPRRRRPRASWRATRATTGSRAATASTRSRARTPSCSSTRPIIGHDVLNGRGNDTDYDAESGDDIMFQGPGIQRNNGMAGLRLGDPQGEHPGRRLRHEHVDLHQPAGRTSCATASTWWKACRAGSSTTS